MAHFFQVFCYMLQIQIFVVCIQRQGCCESASQPQALFIKPATTTTTTFFFFFFKRMGLDLITTSSVLKLKLRGDQL